MTARKDTFGYRARKFIDKTVSVAAVLMAISLLAGMAATLWEAHIARMERARAERRYSDMRQLCRIGNI